VLDLQANGMGTGLGRRHALYHIHHDYYLIGSNTLVFGALIRQVALALQLNPESRLEELDLRGNGVEQGKARGYVFSIYPCTTLTDSLPLCVCVCAGWTDAGGVKHAYESCRCSRHNSPNGGRCLSRYRYTPGRSMGPL